MFGQCHIMCDIACTKVKGEGSICFTRRGQLLETINGQRSVLWKMSIFIKGTQLFKGRKTLDDSYVQKETDWVLLCLAHAVEKSFLTFWIFPLFFLSFKDLQWWKRRTISKAKNGLLGNYSLSIDGIKYYPINLLIGCATFTLHWEDNIEINNISSILIHVGNFTLNSCLYEIGGMVQFFFWKCKQTTCNEFNQFSWERIDFSRPR